MQLPPSIPVKRTDPNGPIHVGSRFLLMNKIYSIVFPLVNLKKKKKGDYSPMALWRAE